MTIRTRLTLWYAAIMFTALMVMGVLLYFQLVIEPRTYREIDEQLRHADRQACRTEHADFRNLRDVIGIVLWCGVPGSVAGLAGGWWLTRKSLAPVTGLTQAAEKINAHNLREPLPRTGNGDEFDRLTEVFNDMLARLDDSFNRIREFTLHASHELKTPLTVLCGETETALRDESLSAAERERAASQLG